MKREKIFDFIIDVINTSGLAIKKQSNFDISRMRKREMNRRHEWDTKNITNNNQMFFSVSSTCPASPLKRTRKHDFDVRSDVCQVVITIISPRLACCSAHCFTFFFSLIDQYSSRIFVAYLQSVFVCCVSSGCVCYFFHSYLSSLVIVILSTAIRLYSRHGCLLCVRFLGCQPIQST